MISASESSLASSGLCFTTRVVLKWRTSSYEKDGKTVYTQSMFIQEMEYCGKKADSPAPYDDSFMNIPEGLEEELPFR